MKTLSKAKRHTARKNDFTGSGASGGKSGQQSLHAAKEISESSPSGERANLNKLPMSIDEFDRRFDEGEDLESLGVDLSEATRPGLESKRMTLDLPAHFMQKLDRAAAIRGVTRQSLIKLWLYDRWEQEAGSSK